MAIVIDSVRGFFFFKSILVFVDLSGWFVKNGVNSHAIVTVFRLGLCADTTTHTNAG